MRHAQSRAESPLSSCALTLLPCLRSVATMAAWPCSAARVSGVAPNSPRWHASLPSFKSFAASGTPPRVHAAMS